MKVTVIEKEITPAVPAVVEKRIVVEMTPLQAKMLAALLAASANRMSWDGDNEFTERHPFGYMADRKPIYDVTDSSSPGFADRTGQVWRATVSFRKANS